MTDDETEETIILTRRDRRRAGTISDAAEAESPEDADEATIVVNRAKTAPEDVSDAAPAPAPSPDSSDSSGAPEPSEDVEALEEEGEADPLDEATVLVDRSAEPKTDAADESTVVVSRPARRLRRKRVADAGSDPSSSHETTAGRRVDSFAAPTDGPAPAIYKPRPAPLTPVAPPVVVGAAAPTRIEDPGLPSVAKQGQRWSLLTLAAAAGACVVSVAGLVALGFVVFG
ncbi:hypothetical protein [Microbacterium maritypicum]|uniref:Uncharacterized protein n=1 Tax=Microbacterium maritypicum TaxID=33918 RepID=A0AAJ5VC97_MICMQ|nr:hypothetical protein [Microbacterium liquefaciens]WEF21615.1 hypothetical protein PWF71_02775 [Microbacterium liquefaciens]